MLTVDAFIELSAPNCLYVEHKSHIICNAVEIIVFEINTFKLANILLQKMSLEKQTFMLLISSLLKV